MAEICISSYSIEKVRDFSYLYLVNAGFSVKTEIDSDNIHKNKFICHFYEIFFKNKAVIETYFKDKTVIELHITMIIPNNNVRPPWVGLE